MSIKEATKSMEEYMIEGLLNHIEFMQNGPNKEKVKDWTYISLEELILDLGIRFTPAKLPEGYTPKEIGYCFNNTLELVASNSNLVYVEGIAAFQSSMGRHHAWAIDLRNPEAVIDVTWGYTEENVYYGIPISLGYLYKALNSKPYLPVFGNWERDFEDLKEGVSETAFHSIYEDLKNKGLLAKEKVFEVLQK